MVAASQQKRKGEEHRERMAARMREFTASVADIGDIPKVKNRRRRNACRVDLYRFLTTYFPRSTGLSPFSDDHRRVIDRVQRCILHGGRFVNAVYRGFAKTTISENAAVWATVYGHRRFVVIFGADRDAADGNVGSIKLELEDNDLLYEDFPEVCHAIRHLEGRPQRRMSQSYRGERTHIEWTADQLMLPTIPGSVASGAVICARGITAGFRGLKVKLPDGTQQRPDLIILDDPQTDESASTPLQVHKTLNTLRKAVVKLGGHRRELAIVMNATVIQQDDAIDNLLDDTAWQGERIPLVRTFPDAHETLWLKDYATLRRTYDKDRVGDQERAHAAATEFYRSRRAEMDAGAEVSWGNCFNPEKEISAIQHAYNALIDDGREAFASEYQVRPLPRQAEQPDDLKADAIAQRVNQSPRGQVPPGCTRLTAFIDVQGDLLWWLVAAWTEGFGGAVVDYGAWPDQRRDYFTLADARPTLAQATKIATLEGSLYAGLTALTTDLLGREWSGLKIEKCLVDSGWGTSTELVYRFCRQSGHAVVLQPSKGVGVSASMVPMVDWPDKPGQRRGWCWVMPPPQPGQARRVLYDANGWKSAVAAKLRLPMGESGGLTLFGDDAAVHRMLADHCIAEYRVRTSGRGRDVEEWKMKPHRPDNHLWDALCGAAVAASILGVRAAGVPDQAKTRKRVSFAELQRRAREGR